MLPLDRPGDSLQFLECEDVVIEDVQLWDAPNWTVRFGGCDNVRVARVTIENNPRIPNSDGIHCTSCTRVLIHDCHITAGDDAIAISGIGPFGTETRDVIVSHCSLASRSAGVRVGYGASPIAQCIFSDLTISANRGVGVFTREGGSVEGVVFRNLLIDSRLHRGHWWGHGEPIHVSAVPMSVQEIPGPIRGVSFDNVSAEADTGIVCYASEPGLVSGIRLDHITLQLRNSVLSNDYSGNLDLRPAYPLSAAIFAHDEGGLLVRNVDGLEITNVVVRSASMNAPSPFVRHAVRIEDCRRITVDRVEVIPSEDQPDRFGVVFKECTEVDLQRTSASVTYQAGQSQS